jgi:ABC-2 type transport system permease protein
MSAVVINSADITARWMRALIRQPWWIAITLVQPIIWLLLFGALFQSVVEIPGFQVANYNDYLAPGIVVMTALFSAGWSGFGMLQDMDKGIMDRFLVTPVGRIALIVGPIAQNSIVTIVQSLIIVGLALLIGASFPGGVGGVLALFAVALLLAAAVAAFSNAIALLVRQEETLIGVVNFVTLPLTFLSSTFMQLSLAPQWIQEVARFNPVNWAAEAGREAVIAPSPDWSFILERIGLLAALAAVMLWWATRAFRAYQRSA